MAKFKGVDPKNSHAAAFERQVRSEYLNPFIKFIITNSAGLAGDIPFAILINAIGGMVRSWLASQAQDRLVRAAITWAGSVDRYHHRAFINDFKRAGKVDITKALDNSGGGIGDIGNIFAHTGGGGRGFNITVGPVDIRQALAQRPINDILRESIEDSVSYIKTIPERYHEQLTQLYIAGETESPLDLAAREKMLKEGFNGAAKSAGYNLRRITRDQSNKLTGHLTRARQQAVGVDQYVWRTSEDDRVRPTHVEKNGRIFQWGIPPADTGPPGHDIQCRCVAIPYLTIDQIKSRIGQS